MTILLSLVEGAGREAILRNLRATWRHHRRGGGPALGGPGRGLDVEYEAISLIKRLKGLIA